MARSEFTSDHRLQSHGILIRVYHPKTFIDLLFLQISSLDDVKSVSQTDNNAMKQIALDHLGVIAARLRSSTLKFKPVDDGGNGKKKSHLRPMDEVVLFFVTRERI